jgi:hypothetical protein
LSTFGYGNSKIGDFGYLCQRVSTLNICRNRLIDKLVPKVNVVNKEISTCKFGDSPNYLGPSSRISLNDVYKECLRAIRREYHPLAEREMLVTARNPS